MPIETLASVSSPAKRPFVRGAQSDLPASIDADTYIAAAEQPDALRATVLQKTNFGGNQRWQSRVFRPRNEQDVLDILDRNRDRHIRPLGSLHSWSPVAVTPDVNLDMSAFNSVQPFERNGQTFVRVGAGCVLKNLLDQLQAATDTTLPTMGGITRQTISGAISTGTHGSGTPGLSHWVAGVRLAAYDPQSGRARIYEYNGGDELRAARCGLGLTGVILSVDLHTVPRFLVKETVRSHRSLDEVLSTFKDNPLTQFILTPYRWDYLSFERNPEAMRGLTAAERVKRTFFRVFNKVAVDVGLHLGIKSTLWLGAPFVKGFLKLTPHLMVRNVSRIDTNEEVLTTGHDMFQYGEMEFFLPEHRMHEAVDVLQAATDVFAGTRDTVPPRVEQTLKSIGMYDELMRNRGRYVHHYPYFFRRLMPEDTLISMGASNKEPSYSVSVYCYLPPEKRDEFNEFSSWLAGCMNGLVGARLHWGKQFPLEAAQVTPHYPELARFKQICHTTDPNGVFQNEFTRRVLGPA